MALLSPVSTKPKEIKIEGKTEAETERNTEREKENESNREKKGGDKRKQKQGEERENTRVGNMKMREEGKIEKETDIKTSSMVCVCMCVYRVACAFKVREAVGA